MNRWILTLAILFHFAGIFLWTSPAMADTTYNAEAIPTVRDGEIVKMGRLVITGTSTLTFTGDNDRAEFRLPPDFYITSTGIYGQADSDCGVVLRVVRGFDDPSAVTIRPIAEDPYNPGHYGGFQLDVEQKSGGDGYKPEMILYFDNVYVPRGWTGDVKVTIERSESSGFSSREIKIAKVDTAKLTLEAEKIPSLVADQRVGPILITENMGGAFDYIEFSLPPGFKWEGDSAFIDPGLGLNGDYDWDDILERDYTVDVFNNKYGHSVLRVERQGERSTSKGNLRVECNVTVNEGIAAYGDVYVTVSGEAGPTSSQLKVATYNERTISISTRNTKQLYGGLSSQEIGEIILSENAPGALIGNGRVVNLELPSWAKWDEVPSVYIEGATELELGLNNSKAFPVGDEDRRVRFYISRSSKNRAGKVIIKEGKVSLPVDAKGDLKIKISGNAGVSGEATVGAVNVPLTVTSSAKPELKLGVRGQQAGDIEIKENAGQVLLARELWLDFPSYITLKDIPAVEVSSGNMIIDKPRLEDHRLIIPIEVSGSSASTIRVTGISYDITHVAPEGDVEVRVGGPAVNEVNMGNDALFSGKDWAAIVVNATVAPPPKYSPPKFPFIGRNVVFQVGEKSYRLNGRTYTIDVAPYIKNGRVFLPLRYAGLALGIDRKISWDRETGTASLVRNDTVVRVKVGDSAVYRSGVRIPTDAAAHLHEGRVMVPLRAVATAFGANVDWESDTQTVKMSIFPTWQTPSRDNDESVIDKVYGSD